MKSEQAVGIDFGTTNCAIARHRGDGEVFMVCPIPSIGAWHNGQLMFGVEARELLRSEDLTVEPIRDLKLALDGRVAAGRWDLDPVEAATALLLHIREHVPRDQESIRSAVIGTPVRVTRNERQALREAAMRAGFDDIRFVYEPTAALIGARSTLQQSRGGLVLVVDWGGGTLDISVVEVKDGLYRELTVDGDRDTLGGTRIDHDLTLRLLESSPEANRRLEEVPGGFNRLKDEVEEAKLTILHDLRGEDAEAIPVAPFWLRDMLFLEPEAVFDVVRSYATRAAEQILAMLRNANIAKEEITQVLFAGGTCGTQIVRQEIIRLFPRAEALVTSKPQDLTARGCAKLASNGFALELSTDIALREADEQSYVLLNRGPVSIGRHSGFQLFVTDVFASKAHLDVGVRREEQGRSSLKAAGGSSFSSLAQLDVPIGTTPVPGGKTEPDLVYLRVAIEENLTIHVKAEGSRKEEPVETYISGIPLLVRPEGDLCL